MKPYSALFLATLASATTLFALGCAPEIVAIEILPARTSATCSPPNLTSSSAGSGLLDLNASESLHGSYVADIRVTARGGDARITSLDLSYTLPEGVGTADADDASGARVVGDLFLAADETDPVAGIIENVELLPRALARSLQADDDLDADTVEFATIEVILNVDDETLALETPASFPLSVCRGCLVTEPDEEECPDGFEETAACRPGQDVELFKCSSAAAAPAFP